MPSRRCGANSSAAGTRRTAQPYTAKYKEPYAALIERRPDLPYITLTCENTHTALPYIDVVNEILEYYVAHDGLDAEAARDTGERHHAGTAGRAAEHHAAGLRQASRGALPAHSAVRSLDRDGAPVLRLLRDAAVAGARDVPDRRRAVRAGAALRPRGDLLRVAGPLARRARDLHRSRSAAADGTSCMGSRPHADATTVAIDADTKQRIDLNSAKALSRRLGVTYKEFTEIVQTGFVNPKLDRLVVLYKLGVSIHSVKLARGSREHDALRAEQGSPGQGPRAPCRAADQARYDALTQDDWQTLEGAAGVRHSGFRSSRHEFHLTPAQVEAELQAIPYDSILVLADPDAGCDFDQTTLRYASGRAADDIAFLRINLFVRLWRKLGWTIEETDRALQAFVPANAPFEPRRSTSSRSRPR